MQRAAMLLASLRRPFRLVRSEDGQDLIEYGLLVGLIAIIAIAAVGSMGTRVTGVFWQTIANSI